MPCDACNADTVIRCRGDDTGDMCAVSTFVIGRVVTFNPIAAPRHCRRVAEIPTVDVVNVTVPIIVNAVAGNFVGILPEL